MKLSFSHPNWMQAVMLMQPEQNGMPFDDDAAQRFIDMASSSDTTTNTSQESERNLLALCKFHKSKDVVKPDFHFSAGASEFCQGDGLTAISGKAKQGKSQFATILAGILLSGRNFGGIERKGGGKCVAWIDTEQNEYNINKNLDRLYHLGNIPTDTPTEEIGLHVFSALQIEEQERIELLQQIIAQLQPDTIFIDGIGDFIDDFNNISVSKHLIEWLLRLCNTHKVNIVCVMHTNEGNDMMQGSFGRYLLKKCNDRFEVTKVADHFNVKHLASRDLQMRDFDFFIDSNGYLQPYNDMPLTDEEVLTQIFEGAEEGLFFDYIEKEFKGKTGLSKDAAHKRLLDCINIKKILHKQPDKRFMFSCPF